MLHSFVCLSVCYFFFFNDTATTEIYTLSLHDALPICGTANDPCHSGGDCCSGFTCLDRKSTRLNSSHPSISYAVFCLKKKNQQRRFFDSTQTIKKTPKHKDNNHKS